MINKETLSTFFKEQARRPLSFREISEQLGLSRPEARSLKRVLREMLREGEVVLNRRGMYGPSGDMNLIVGYFEAHRDGYGFVICDKPGERDIFVPSSMTMGAMGGDRVIVRVEQWKKRSGRVIRILERAYTRIVGTFDETKNAAYVRPRSKNASFSLYIGAKDRDKARHGDTVIAEIIDYPSDRRSPSGRVVKVLQQPDEPKAEVEMIIDEYNLPRRFPKVVTDEAKLISAKLQSAGDLPKRKDLRDLPTVTIDGERAKDFDDAISISRIAGGYKLWVHIADVGHYVPWGSALDIEARKRGTSTYLPDRVIPMLPKELSEDLCSLRPEVERFAFTVEMDYDSSGSRIGVKFYPSLIMSNERMTYTSVRKILIDQDPDERRTYQHLLGEFGLMQELCDLLRAGRLSRGSLDFDLPEPEILLDLQGNPEAIIRSERNFAHMVIEEFMIAANEAVAEHLEKLGIPSLYRIHEEPDPMKLEDIMKVIGPLSRQGRKGLKPKDFASLLASIKGTPEEEVTNYIILRSLKQARYSPVNVGHFGLASESYTHFTSPIRRYPDLVVHRILREVLTRKRLSDTRTKELAGSLADIGFTSSRRERLADEAEKKVVDAMRVWFMKERVGESFPGRVVGITPFGLRVRLDEYYVDGFIHVSYLTDDFYQLDDRTMQLVGRNTRHSFKIGQALTLRVDKVDMVEREIVFGL